jgi:hypothetical protein
VKRERTNDFIIQWLIYKDIDVEIELDILVYDDEGINELRVESSLVKIAITARD